MTIRKLKDTIRSSWIMKNKKEIDLKSFTKGFFEGIGAKIKEKDRLIEINNVPKSFERIFEKKSPYYLVFDSEDYSSQKTELITKGSPFFKAIKEYMANIGETTLYKLTINEKKSIPFFRFTFITQIQYLNEKNHFINSFFIKDKAPVKVNMDKIRFSQGKKQEISDIDLKEEYDIAKKELEFSLENDLKEIKGLLKEKLRKNIWRVKMHYQKQLKEKDSESAHCKKNITKLENELKHAYYKSKIKDIKNKIEKLLSRLEHLEKEGYKERLEAEEKFHINDEIQKHGLLIKNRLINISVFY
jgi:hypothetical protein